jgi:hypothetical protein
MLNAMTITSKDSQMPLKILKPSFVFEYPTRLLISIDTITIPPQSIRVVLDEIDDEMRAIENAAMFDFWKFEAMD